MARGVDAAAHRGALLPGTAAQGGGTIGVIGGGLDKPYPPENIDLHGVMAREGLLVAEMPMGTEPQARHFPAATASSPGFAREPWWSRRRPVRAR
jgi:DNA processing protein